MSALRILIAGVPKAGKTMLAQELIDLHAKLCVGMTDGLDQVRALAIAPVVRHTDDLIATREWSAASLEVSRWMDEPGSWVIEGVAVPRALRKWMLANAGKPADVVYWSDQPYVELTKGQATMAEGCKTVWREVRPELVLRGVELRYF